MSPKAMFFGLLALMLCIPAMAADFSGSYSLQRGDATLEIQHDGDNLSFVHTRTDRSGQTKVTSFAYAVDGQNRSVPALSGDSRVVSAHWANESTLLVESARGDQTVVETWRLSGDTLTLEMAPDSDRSRLNTRTIVFER